MKRSYAWESGLVGDIVVRAPLAELTMDVVTARVSAALPDGWSARWNFAYAADATLFASATFYPYAGARYAVDALTMRQLSLFD